MNNETRKKKTLNISRNTADRIVSEIYETYRELPILNTVTDLITNEYEPSIEKAISSMKQLEKKYGIKFNYVDIDSRYIDWYIP